jgi:hypothetical protein
MPFAAQHHVSVAELLALDQHLGAGDQHDAVLPLFGIEIGGSPSGPLTAAAVARAIAALQLAELLAAERPTRSPRSSC